MRCIRSPPLVGCRGEVTLATASIQRRPRWLRRTVDDERETIMSNDFRNYSLCVDRWLLEKQIEAVCESNIDPELLDGIHHLLGEILDQHEGKGHKISIGIETSGGCITAVHCSRDFEYEIFDWDDLGGDNPKAEANIAKYAFSG